MEAVSENTENELFNLVLVKVSGGTVTVFNPIGWCTDMAGSNLSAVRYERYLEIVLLTASRNVNFTSKSL